MNMRRISVLLSTLLILAALPVGAALPTVSTPPASPAPVFGAAGLLQAGLGLAGVLALIFLCAWAARRFGLQQPGTGHLVKVIANTMIGQRERVVVVEIGTSWLVLGVTPGQIRPLHTMPAEELPPRETTPLAAAATSATSAANAFSKKLRDSISKLQRPD